MATLTIRNIDELTKRALRLRAASKGHSMEEEVRQILGKALQPTAPHLVDKIRMIVDQTGGMELDIPPREIFDVKDVFGDFHEMP